MKFTPIGSSGPGYECNGYLELDLEKPGQTEHEEANFEIFSFI